MIKLIIMKESKSQEKDKNRTPYYKWDKKRGFTIVGYIIEDKDGKTNRLYIKR